MDAKELAKPRSRITRVGPENIIRKKNVKVYYFADVLHFEFNVSGTQVAFLYRESSLSAIL